MNPGVMIAVGILMGAAVPPPTPTPSIRMGGGRGRSAVRINGRMYYGTDFEISRLIRDFAAREAEEQPAQASRKAAKRQARKAARQTAPQVELVASPDSPTIDVLMARNAVLQAQVRDLYARSIAETMVGLQRQIAAEDENAAIAAVEMML